MPHQVGRKENCLLLYFLSLEVYYFFVVAVECVCVCVCVFSVNNHLSSTETMLCANLHICTLGRSRKTEIHIKIKVC